jgi:hypothetical protein
MLWTTPRLSGVHGVVCAAGYLSNLIAVGASDDTPALLALGSVVGGAGFGVSFLGLFASSGARSHPTTAQA